MRESIGGAWLLGIVLVFMSVFIAYIAITINYSNAFKMKTKMITVIEQYQGINSNSLQKMEGMLSDHAYKIKAMCPSSNDKYLGVDGGVVTTNPTTKQRYCLYREKRVAQSGSDAKYYYRLIVFFNFSLPVLGDLFTFKIDSETNAILYPNDTYF